MFRTTIAATAACLAVTACTSSIDGVGTLAPPATPAASAAPVAAAPSTSTDEDMFLAVVHGAMHHQYGDGDLVKVAHSICGAFDAGNSWVDVVKVGTDEGMDPYDVGVLTAAAVDSFCPEYADQLPS